MTSALHLTGIFRFSTARDSKTARVLPRHFNAHGQPPSGHGCITLRAATSRAAIKRLSYPLTRITCVLRCRRTDPFGCSAHQGFPWCRAHVLGTRSTIARRPWSGLITRFHDVAGFDASYLVARFRVAQPRGWIESLSRTGHCRPERSLPRSEPHYRHCAAASRPRLAIVASSRRGGGNPSLARGLAAPLSALADR